MDHVILLGEHHSYNKVLDSQSSSLGFYILRPPKKQRLRGTDVIQPESLETDGGRPNPTWEGHKEGLRKGDVRCVAMLQTCNTYL